MEVTVLVNEAYRPEKICWQLQALGASYGGGLEGVSSAYAMLREDVEGGDAQTLDEMMGTCHLMALDFDGAFRYLERGSGRYRDAVDVLQYIGNDPVLMKEHAQPGVYEDYIREKALSNVMMGCDGGGFFLDEESFSFILSELEERGVDVCDHIAQTVRTMEENGKRNTPKMMLLADSAGDRELYDCLREEYMNKVLSRRDCHDTRIAELCAADGDFSYIAKLQEGDNSPFFPIASSVYLLENNHGREVFKEHLRLYTDFSRYSGYTNEKGVLERVAHPDIIGYHGSVTLDDHEFLRLEYFEGDELSAKKGDASLSEAAHLIRLHADVLSYLHGKGIMYMDVKDKNTLYGGGQMRLLDFGMAQMQDSPVGDATEARSLLSTPQYVPPEWSTRFRVNNRSEVFQLGVLMYQLLSGCHPFVEEENEPGDDDRMKGLVSYTLGNIYRQYESPRQLEGESHLDSLLEHMLAKDSAARPRLEEVSKELTAYERRWRV